MTETDDHWIGEERHLEVTGGVGHVEDDDLVYYDAFDEPDAWNAFVYHGGGNVSISTGYDDGKIDYGALVNLTPAEAQRLASLLLDAVEYEIQVESNESPNCDHQSKIREKLERFTEVLE